MIVHFRVVNNQAKQHETIQLTQQHPNQWNTNVHLSHNAPEYNLQGFQLESCLSKLKMPNKQAFSRGLSLRKNSLKEQTFGLMLDTCLLHTSPHKQTSFSHTLRHTIWLCAGVWFSCTGKLSRAWCWTHAAPNPFPAARLLFVFAAHWFPREQRFIPPPLLLPLHVVDARLGSNWWWWYLCAMHALSTGVWRTETRLTDLCACCLKDDDWKKKEEREGEERHMCRNWGIRVEETDQIKHYEKARWWQQYLL